MMEPRSIDEDRLQSDREYRWKHGKEVMRFEERDWEAIRDSEPHLRPRLDAIVESLYEELMKYGPTASFYRNEDGSVDEERYRHRVEGFVLWFERIFEGPEDRTFIKYIQDVGRIHTEHLGFDEMVVNPFYMGPAFGLLFDEIAGILARDLDDTRKLARMLSAWQRLFLLQQDMMNWAYGEESVLDPSDSPSSSTSSDSSTSPGSR